MKRTRLTRVLSFLLVFCMIAGNVAGTALAATVDEATINESKTANLNLYKYDFTNAAKDGVWSTESYVSTGQYDKNINDTLGAAQRQGDSDGETVLGNQGNSYGYAIKGVEFSYLKVADIYQYSQTQQDGASSIEVLYKFDKLETHELLDVIGLKDGRNSHAEANALDGSCWYYRSDVINKALSESLAANPTVVKNALESFLSGNNGIAMPLTDEYGHSSASNLPLGLYLLAETKVPEMVTATTNPFFISLPMTNVNGGGLGTSVTDGGHAWLYDVTIYPKNETGIVTLEKTVREEADKDGFKHNATASTGDTVEYQIISTLPTITSKATHISKYEFQDILSRGLSYSDKGLKIEWFTDKACTSENKVAEWTEEDGKFIVEHKPNDDGSHTMTINMTNAGLNEINNGSGKGNSNGQVYSGYSNYTLRITYSAVLNADESMVYGDAGNCNEVVLTWSRTSSSYYDTLVDDCHVYSYGINLTKKFSDGKEDQSLFDHVLFKVQNKTDGYFVVAKLNQEEGIWYVTGYTSDEDEATAFYPVEWNNKKGQIVIKGLEDDEYIMTEVETANGYLLLDKDICVKISATPDNSRPCDIYSGDILGVIQNDPRFSFDGGLDLTLANIPQTALAHNMVTASATVDGNPVTMVNDEEDTASTNALVPLSVTNTVGFDLPQSGETGATWLPIFGGLLIGIAIIGLGTMVVFSRKKGHG